MHLAEELILKKRDGVELSAPEITRFVQGISSGLVSDAQIAAFTMSTWFRGMTIEEQMALTLAMRDSGEVLAWPDLDGPVLDKHSTGGVGDLVSLVLGPVIAAEGGYVPMISGRGLGHTGGTLDKLESIPGFDTAPGAERFQSLVRENRIAIIGQTEKLAPADRRIYAVRDVTATVASTPLIISSILSKKLAEGLDGLVMDIKFGSGAFTPDPDDAKSLADEICRVSCEAGLPCNAVISNMDEPLAWSAGNALEVLEAIRFLRGDEQRERLLEVVLSLCGELLFLGQLAADPGEGARRAAEALESGRAAEQFALMVSAQGGPADIMDKPERHLHGAPVIRAVFPEVSGYVSAVDTQLVGTIVVALGGGRHGPSDTLDPAVGISDIVEVGCRVEPGIPLARVHAADENSWEVAAAHLRYAVSVGERPAELYPAVLARVEGVLEHD